jgi:hypothetical protein
MKRLTLLGRMVGSPGCLPWLPERCEKSSPRPCPTTRPVSRTLTRVEDLVGLSGLDCRRTNVSACLTVPDQPLSRLCTALGETATSMGEAVSPSKYPF